jgi:hypothetical protein
MGERVDVLVFSDNTVSTIAGLKDTAAALNVDINWSKANFAVVQRNRTHIISPLPKYKFFVFMGNEKVPSVSAIGDMNVYMNQFPFDLDRKLGHGDLEKVSSYDFVVVNSEYTRSWFNQYSQEIQTTLMNLRMRVPQSIVIYPPITLMQRSQSKVKGKKPWIVVTGRFFADTIRGVSDITKSWIYLPC